MRAASSGHGGTPLVASGASRIVLDNTYVSRASSALVVRTAARFGLPVRCVWLSTGLEDAQVNAAWRIVSRYGRLLGPEEMREASKQDTAAFGPAVVGSVARIAVLPLVIRQADSSRSKRSTIWPRTGTILAQSTVWSRSTSSGVDGV